MNCINILLIVTTSLLLLLFSSSSSHVSHLLPIVLAQETPSPSGSDVGDGTTTTTSSSPLQKSSSIASPPSPFPSTESRWTCPTSCGAMADQWCQSNFGYGGSVTSTNCILDESNVNVLSFDCVCNSDSSSSANPIQIIRGSVLSSTTSVPPSTTTTTTAIPTTTTSGNFSSDSNETSTSTTAVASNTTTTTNMSSTTTATTESPPVTTDTSMCQVAPQTNAYFQASPFGMFCRAPTGTCPTSCSTSTSSSSASSSSDSRRNPSLVQYIEDCRYGILTCSQTGNTIIATCETCNAGVYTITTQIQRNTTTTSVTNCSHQVSYSSSSSSSPFDVVPIGSCSGLRNCNGNGCCSQESRCSCFTNDIVGTYEGSSCSTCDPRYTRDSVFGLCTNLIPPFLYRLSSLLGTRPSALIAPVLVVAALVSLVSFLVRTRWPSDQERYVVPAGVALVDPVSGYSVSPNSRFYIPPRPTASRGIVNQRLSEKQAEMLKNLMTSVAAGNNSSNQKRNHQNANSASAAVNRLMNNNKSVRK